MFALKTLGGHGIVDSILHDITKATLVAQLTYTAFDWWGFLSAADTSRLQSVIKKAVQFGYLLPSYGSFEELCLTADENLFFSVRYNPNHVLHQLLPQPKNSNYNLRDCSHNFTLPTMAIS